MAHQCRGRAQASIEGIALPFESLLLARNAAALSVIGSIVVREIWRWQHASTFHMPLACAQSCDR